MLTDDERRLLLGLARQSIEHHVRRKLLTTAPASIDGVASGVFVTIRARGELRGCLGVLEMRGSLADEIVRCARDSASEDPRFPPLRSDELQDVSLEISVLGAFEPVDPLLDGAVVVGRHGLLVQQGDRRGLLLPQVAVEWNWTREQFLDQTCRKAGLPLGAWRRGALVFRFEADVFGE